MRMFFQKSVQHLENSSGRKKSSFQIIKGKNGEVEQIKGFSTDDNKVFHIKQQKIKRNDITGQPKVSYKIFKIKSSNLQNLINDKSKVVVSEKSKKSSDKNVKSKKSSAKKVISKKSSDIVVKSKKSSNKKVTSKKSSDTVVKSKKLSDKKVKSKKSSNKVVKSKKSISKEINEK